jgi:histidyl-tRNA synthetase
MLAVRWVAVGATTIWWACLAGKVVGRAARLRQAGITVDLYPEQARLGRQLAAADMAHIPYALIIGPDEIAQQQYNLKNLTTGEQQRLDEAMLRTKLMRIAEPIS